MTYFEVGHGALAQLLWADAKDRKMPGVYAHKIESEISQHKEQKWQVQINSPGVDMHWPFLLQLPFLHIQVNGKKLIKEA